MSDRDLKKALKDYAKIYKGDVREVFLTALDRIESLEKQVEEKDETICKLGKTCDNCSQGAYCGFQFNEGIVTCQDWMPEV